MLLPILLLRLPLRNCALLFFLFDFLAGILYTGGFFKTDGQGLSVESENGKSCSILESCYISKSYPKFYEAFNNVFYVTISFIPGS